MRSANYCIMHNIWYNLLMNKGFVASLTRIGAIIGVTIASLLVMPIVASAQPSNTNTTTTAPPTSDTQPATNDGVTIITPSPTASPSPAGGSVQDPVLRNTLNNICAGANLDITSGCNDSQAGADAEERFTRLLRSVVNIFSTVVGVVAVIMIIIGGLRYITSGGDSSNVSSAKNTILYVVVGLVVVAMAQIIVRFVVSRLQTATT
jgi:hypothetical protein